MQPESAVQAVAQAAPPQRYGMQLLIVGVPQLPTAPPEHVTAEVDMFVEVLQEAEPQLVPLGA